MSKTFVSHRNTSRLSSIAAVSSSGPQQCDSNSSNEKIVPRNGVLSCPACPFTVSHRGDFKKHIKKCYGAVSVDQWKCLFCDMSYVTKLCLTTHMLKKHGLTNAVNGLEAGKNEGNLNNSIDGSETGRSRPSGVRNAIDALETGIQKLGMRQSLDDAEGVRSRRGNLISGESRRTDAHMFLNIQSSSSDESLKKSMSTVIKKVPLSQYQCKKCSYKTKIHAELMRHMHIHAKVGLFSCSECEFRTKASHTMLCHLNKVHDITKNHTSHFSGPGDGWTDYAKVTNESTKVLMNRSCSDSEGLTSDTDIMQIHSKNTADENDESARSAHHFECKLCGLHTMYQKNLMKHLVTVHKISKDSSSYCVTITTAYDNIPKKRQHVEDDWSSSEDFERKPLKKARLNSSKDVTSSACSRTVMNSLKSSLQPSSSALMVNPLMKGTQICSGLSYNVNSYRKGQFATKKNASKKFKDLLLLGMDSSVEEMNSSDAKIQCLTCSLLFSSKRTLSCHMKAHENLQRYRCDTCGIRRNFRSTVRQHVKKFHGGKGSITLLSSVQAKATILSNSAGGGEVQRPSSRKSVKYFDGEKRFQCSMCLMKLSSEKNLQIHMVSHTNVGYQCSFCGLKKKSRSSIRFHIKRMHGGKAKCIRVLLSGASASSSIQANKKCKAQSLKPTDSDGPRLDDRRASTSSESSNLHGIDESLSKPFSCTVCSLTFEKLSKFHLHLDVHADLRRYQCILCKLRTNYKGNLNTHVRKFHRGHTSSLVTRVLSKIEAKNTIVAYKKNVRFLKLHNRKTGQKDHMFDSKFSYNRKLSSAVHLKSKNDGLSMKMSARNGEFDLNNNQISLSVYHSRHKKNKFLCRGKKCKFCDFRSNWGHSLLRHEKMAHSVTKATDARHQSDEEFLSNESLVDVKKEKNGSNGVENELSQVNVAETLKDWDTLRLRRFLCGLCGFRSNYRCDVNKHQKAKHGSGLTVEIMKDEEARETLDFYVASRLSRRGKPMTSSPAAVVSKTSLARWQVSPSKDDLVCETSPRAVDVENPLSQVNVVKTLKDVDTLGLRRFLCGLCGFRSNYRWDVGKHQKAKHGSGLTVEIMKDEEARETLDFYVASRLYRKGKPITSSTAAVVSPGSPSKDSPVCKMSLKKQFRSKIGQIEFKKSIEVRSHSVVNADLRRYQCVSCNWRTNYKGNLKIHLMNIHGVNPSSTSIRVLPKTEAKKTISGYKKLTTSSNRYNRFSKKLHYDANCEEDDKFVSDVGPVVSDTRTFGREQEVASSLKLTADNFLEVLPTQTSQFDLNDNKISLRAYHSRRKKNKSLSHRKKCKFCDFRSNWGHNLLRHERMHVEIAHSVTKVTDARHQSDEEFLSNESSFDVKKEKNGSNGVENELSQVNVVKILKDVDTLRLRRFLCGLCGFRSNYRWDVNKHQKAKHGSGLTVEIMKDEEARETLDFYVASRLSRRGKPMSSSPAAVVSKTSLARWQVSPSKADLVCETSPRAEDVENLLRKGLLSPKIHLVACTSDSTQGIQDMASGEGLSVPHQTSGKLKCRIVGCSECDFKTLWPESLKRLLASLHGRVDVENGNKALVCAEKQASFVNILPENSLEVNPISEYRLKRLQKNKRDEIYFRRFTCSLCLFRSNFKHSVFRHVSSKHAEGTAFVKVLPKKLAKKTLFRCKSRRTPNFFPTVPKTETGELSFAPITDDRQITGDSTMQGEVKQLDTKESLFSCEKCPFLTKWHHKLVLHKTHHQPKRGASLKCFQCTFFCRSHTTLRRHVALHQLDNVSTHNKSEIEDDDVKSAAASLCNKAFEKAVIKQKLISSRFIFANTELTNNSATSLCATDLSSLQEVVDRGQLWQCDMCPYRVNKSSFFRRHVSLHAANHRYSCRFCNYSVPSCWWLYQHHQLHLHENRNLLSSQSVTNLMLIPQRLTSNESNPLENGSLKLFEESSYFSSQKFPMFRCNRCPYVTRKRLVFLEHVRCHNPGLCAFCDYNTDFPMHLHSHLMSHFNLPGCEMSFLPPQSRYHPLWTSVIDGVAAYVDSVVTRGRNIQSYPRNLTMVDSQQEMKAWLMETIFDKNESYGNRENVASNLRLVSPSPSKYPSAIPDSVPVEEEPLSLCTVKVDTPPCDNMALHAERVDSPLSDEMLATLLCEDLIKTCIQSPYGVRSEVCGVVLKTDVSNEPCEESDLNFPYACECDDTSVVEMDESLFEYVSKNNIPDGSSVMMVSPTVPAMLPMRSEVEAVNAPSKSLLSSGKECTASPANLSLRSEVEALFIPESARISSKMESATPTVFKTSEVEAPDLPVTSLVSSDVDCVSFPAKLSMSSTSESAISEMESFVFLINAKSQMSSKMKAPVFQAKSSSCSEIEPAVFPTQMSMSSVMDSPFCGIESASFSDKASQRSSGEAPCFPVKSENSFEIESPAFFPAQALMSYEQKSVVCEIEPIVAPAKSPISSEMESAVFSSESIIPFEKILTAPDAAITSCCCQYCDRLFSSSLQLGIHEDAHLIGSRFQVFITE